MNQRPASLPRGKILILFFLITLSPIISSSTSIRAQESRQSKKDAEEVMSLLRQASQLAQESKYDEALAFARRGLEMAEKNLGPEAAAVGMSLGMVARIYQDKGENAKAQPLYERALTILGQSAEPAEDRILMPFLAGLGDIYFRQHSYEKAEPLYKRLLMILEKVEEPNHPATIFVLERLGELYFAQGSDEKAEPVLTRVLPVQERTVEESPLPVASTMMRLAMIYGRQRMYEKAEPLYLQAIALVEKKFGPEHPNVLVPIESLGDLYKNRGDSQRAEEIYKRALAIYEKSGADVYPGLALLLFRLADLYSQKNESKQAEPFYERALSIAEKSLGQEHPDTAMYLEGLAKANNAEGKYEQADVLFQRVLKIRESSLGPDHIYVANTLMDLGWVAINKGEYDKAISLFERNLKIVEKSAGQDQRYVAASISQLGWAYYRKKDYERAEELYKRALSTYEKALGPDSKDSILVLANLAEVYAARANFEEAESLLKRALSISEKSFGPEDAHVAISLDRLGQMYEKQGDYGRAESLFERALAMREKTLGADNPEIVQSLNNLANVYESLGDYGRAEQLYQRVLALREKLLAPDDIFLAFSLNSLANVYRSKGEYKKAEDLLLRSKKITEKARGPESSDAAVVLNQLALLYRAQGDLARAEGLYQQAIKIDEKVYGPEDTAVGVDIHNLAVLYTARGEFAKAEPLLERSLAIEAKAKGANHPDVAETLLSLAYFYGAKGDIHRAIATLTRGTEISERNISFLLATATGTEEQKRAYMAMSNISYETLGAVALHMQFAPQDLQAARLALTTVLRRKGRILDAVSDSMQALQRRSNPDDRVLLKQLTDVRSQLAQRVLKGAGGDVKQYESEVAQLEEQARRLESTASARSSQSRVEFQPVTIEIVQQLIPVDSILVELVTYRPFNPKYRKEGEMWGPWRYAAYLLRHDGNPAWVELGEAAAIDSDLVRLRSALRDHSRSDVKELARALDERVMRPIRKVIAGPKKILISPDGALNLLPFEALVDEQGSYLIENYSFTYLTSGRDLLRLQVQTESQGAAVVIANPLFDAGESVDNGKDEIEKNSARSFDFARARFAPLPGTDGEAKALSAILPGARVLTGPEATERALKQVSRPKILHIATHGFFLSDQKLEPALKRAASRRLEMEEADPPKGPGTRIENPLLRSGLALAGANQRKGGAGEDGILTALEAAGLDLWGTKLIVLSACETGVGEVKNGDGVYGLRRALVIAGAESQLMSLWQVSDAATRDLMIGFYQRLLKGAGRTEALRQAQLDMLHGKEYRHPYYWASFIQSGAWTGISEARQP